MSDLDRACARMICAGFTGSTVPREMADLIARGIGGAVLFKRNFEGAQQFADLCGELKRIAGHPFLTCIDHEGGRVDRLGPPFTPIPPMRAIGASGDPQLARDIGQIMARELRAANIDMNLAPVLDVDSNPANPVIGDRSFGATAELVASMGCAMIAGLQAEGVAACGKHFPGHGDTTQDSHKDLPRLPHEMHRLADVELPPFAAAIRSSVAALMTAHVVFEAIDPSVPATMSRRVLGGVLREQLGFHGVIISDDLEMNAIAGHFALEDVVIRGANAGVDLSMFAHSSAKQNQAIDILIKAVDRGDVAREMIEGAGRRLDRLFEKFVQPAHDGPLSSAVGCAEHLATANRISRSRSPGGADPTNYKPVNL